MGFAERAASLSDKGSEGAEAFVRARGAVTFFVFGIEKTIGRQGFHLVQCLRKASSQLSTSFCHTSTPIEVATALESEGRSVFENEYSAVSTLFQSFFAITSRKMVKDLEDGERKPEFQIRFKASRP